MFIGHAAGVAIYIGATQAKDRIGSIGMWAFIMFHAGLYFATSQGNPPPGIMAVVLAGLIGTTISLSWAWWFDRHREAKISTD